MLGDRQVLRKRSGRGDKPGLVLDVGHDAGDVGIGSLGSGNLQQFRSEEAGGILICVEENQNHVRVFGDSRPQSQVSDRQLDSPRELPGLNELELRYPEGFEDVDVLAAQQLHPDTLQEDPDGVVLSVTLDNGSYSKPAQALSSQSSRGLESCSSWRARSSRSGLN